MEKVIGIAGAGRVAQALGRALEDCGIKIRYVASRERNHAAEAARAISGKAKAVSFEEVTANASHVIIAVPDRAIAFVAEQLTKGKGSLRIAVHTSGSYGAELLSPLRSAGVSCGTFHPLQTIRDGVHGAAALRRAAFTVSGDPDALAWAEEMAELLSGQVLHINPSARHLYHAAAVMASNYITAILDSAEQLMMLSGVPKSDAMRALAPMARTSIDNAVDRGVEEALTGPIARGDAGTVSEHLKALGSVEQSIKELYRAAGVHALAIARRRGLGEEDAENVREALGRR